MTIPSWKVTENQLLAEELPESPLTLDLSTLILTMTNVIEQLQAPQSIAEILKRQDKQRWLDSMHRELKALLKNKTWEYVRRSDIPPGHKVLSRKWVWVIKRDGTYKSRWVVRGFEQVEGVNYQETFAAVARADSYRILLAIATLLDWDIEQVDIDAAFLHRPIDSEIYLEIPTGSLPDLPDGRVMVCRLLRSLYGLKQAPKIWFDTLRKVLEGMGLRRLDTEHSVYTLLGNQGKGKPESIYIGPDLVIAVYVDDIMMIGRTKAVIIEFKKQLGSHFDIKDIGEASDYLGIEIVRNRAAGTLKIH